MLTWYCRLNVPASPKRATGLLVLMDSRPPWQHCRAQLAGPLGVRTVDDTTKYVSLASLAYFRFHLGSNKVEQ